MTKLIIFNIESPKK